MKFHFLKFSEIKLDFLKKKILTHFYFIIGKVGNV
jgi:hypothetical protein